MFHHVVLAILVTLVARFTVGPLTAMAWRGLAGAGRSEREHLLAAAAVTLGIALGWAPLARVAWILAPAIGLGVWLALRVRRQSEATEPQSLRLRHEGWQVELRHASAWPTVLVLLLAATTRWPLVILATLVAAATAGRGPVTTRIRLSAGRVEAGAASLPLRGLLVHDGQRLLGAPTLVLESPEGRIEVPVGGHPRQETAWVKQALEDAAAQPPPPLAPPPPELARLRRAADRDQS